MDTVVTLHDVGPTDVVSVRAAIPERRLPAFLGWAFVELQERLALLGVEPEAEPFVIVHGSVAGAVDAEACLPVRSEVAMWGTMETRHLAGARVARIIHRGPDADLPATRTSLLAWIAEHRLAPAGPVRERCLVGSGDSPRPEDWRTDVQLPVRDIDESEQAAGDLLIPA